MTSPLKADKELAAALGRMTGAWSHIEVLLTMLFMLLTRMPFILAAGIFDFFRNTHMQSRVLKRVAELGTVYNETNRALLKEVLGEYQALADRRNELAHNPFGWSEPETLSGLYVMNKTQGKPGIDGIPYQTRPVTVQEIDQLTADIEMCQIKLHGLISFAGRREGDPLPELPEKFR